MTQNILVPVQRGHRNGFNCWLRTSCSTVEEVPVVSSVVPPGVIELKICGH